MPFPTYALTNGVECPLSQERASDDIRLLHRTWLSIIALVLLMMSSNNKALETLYRMLRFRSYVPSVRYGEVRIGLFKKYNLMTYCMTVRC